MKRILVLLAAILLLSGCATVIHYNQQIKCASPQVEYHGVYVNPPDEINHEWRVWFKYPPHVVMVTGDCVASLENPE